MYETYFWLERSIEGTRTFDVIWGTVAAAILFLIGWNALYWWQPEHRVRLFGPNVDPTMRLQFYWGLLAMMMAGTNVGCRYIPHAFLESVHLGFAMITLAIVLVLGPRTLFLAVAGHRRRFNSERKPAHLVEERAS
jgi:hypothetical protein